MSLGEEAEEEILVVVWDDDLPERKSLEEVPAAEPLFSSGVSR